MQELTKLESLRAAAEEAETALRDAYRALEAEDIKAEYFVYANHEDAEDAEGELYEVLHFRAFKDCQGAYNVGQEEYRQEYIVDGNKFVGILAVEYNRHDKTYYYIDGTEYRYEPVQSN